MFKYFRWLLASILFGLAIFFFSKVNLNSPQGSQGIKEIPNLLYMLGSFILGIIFLTPEFIKIIIYPVTSLFSNTLVSGAKLKKPPLSYKLAEFYIKEERFDDAIYEFEKIIEYYPEEERSYLEIAEISSVIFEDIDEAVDILNKGLKNIPDSPTLKLKLENVSLQKNDENEKI